MDSIFAVRDRNVYVTLASRALRSPCRVRTYDPLDVSQILSPTELRDYLQKSFFTYPCKMVQIVVEFAVRLLKIIVMLGDWDLNLLLIREVR